MEGQFPHRSLDQSVEDSYEPTWVENAALVSTRYTGCNVDELGFPKCIDFLKWLKQGAVSIELNRDCVAGEEIILGYEWTSIIEKMQEAQRRRESKKKDNPAASDVEKIVEEHHPQSPDAGEEVLSDSDVNLKEVPPEKVAEEEKVVSDSDEDVVEVPPEEVADSEEEDYQLDCGECRKKTSRGKGCDVCGSWVHPTCGVPLGGDESSAVRRCTRHPMFCGQCGDSNVPKGLECDICQAWMHPTCGTHMGAGDSRIRRCLHHSDAQNKERTRASPRLASGSKTLPEGYEKKVGHKSMGTPVGSNKRKQAPPAAALCLPAPKKKTSKKLNMAQAVEEYDDYMNDES